MRHPQTDYKEVCRPQANVILTANVYPTSARGCISLFLLFSKDNLLYSSESINEIPMYLNGCEASSVTSTSVMHFTAFCHFLTECAFVPRSEHFNNLSVLKMALTLHSPLHVISD